MFMKSTLIGITCRSSAPSAWTWTGLIGAVLSYVLALVAVFVFAQIINALAPTFGGQKDSVQALKAAAYATTAAWVAGVAQHHSVARRG